MRFSNAARLALASTAVDGALINHLARAVAAGLGHRGGFLLRHVALRMFRRIMPFTRFAASNLFARVLVLLPRAFCWLHWHPFAPRACLCASRHQRKRNRKEISAVSAVSMAA